MSNQQELAELCLERVKIESDLIQEIFSRKNRGQDAHLQMGTEMEFATAAEIQPDGQFSDVDYPALEVYAKPAVPALTMVKTEGQAWVFFNNSAGHEWFKDGKANPAYRFFVPDLSPDQMYDQKHEETIVSNAPRRLLRREIVIGHENMAPSAAIAAADKMEAVTMSYLEANGMHGSFAPKFLEPQDAAKLVDISSVVMWLHLNGHIQGNLKELIGEVKTLGDLEKRGIYFAGMPGNADQTNLSVKTLDSQNVAAYPMFDKATMDGNDLAYRMQKGFITTVQLSALGMHLTPDSYERLSRHSADPIIIAADMAEARPATATHGETKFGGHFVKFSPYTREGNELIASMAGQRGAGYLEQRQADGSNFRQEVRGADQSGVRSLRVLQQLAGDRLGLQMFSHMGADEIKAELLDHSNPVLLPRNLQEAIARHEENQEFFVGLFGKDVAKLMLEVANDNLNRPKMTSRPVPGLDIK
ncbi:MAG TPA: hypothetical protein VFR09_00110 [Alphaproteobacteria bacterium]|nr:hypothetical protein [Alphaproteobacteria bacterium]